jgi:RNA polymerase sigma-70 factor (ECF subfamily)
MLNLRATLFEAAAGRPALTTDETPNLVRSAQSGDRAAFGRLYERFGPMVHGVLLARVPRAEARDLLQDVFLAAFERLRSLREPAAFPGWLATIARNRATDWRRAGRETVEFDDSLPGGAEPPARTLHVLSLIRSLPEAYRETLVMRFVEGMSGPEIAERTGLTAGSVRVNLHRGVELLREKLGVRDDA